MPRLGGWRLPIVIASIKILNRRIGEFLGIHIIEAAELDRVEIPANRIDVPAHEGSHPAAPAKQMVHAVGAELIVSQIGIASEQTKCIRFENCAPKPCLGAD